MKNISQKKWFSLSMKLTEKRDINFSYTNFDTAVLSICKKK